MQTVFKKYYCICRFNFCSNKNQHQAFVRFVFINLSCNPTFQCMCDFHRGRKWTLNHLMRCCELREKLPTVLNLNFGATAGLRLGTGRSTTQMCFKSHCRNLKSLTKRTDTSWRELDDFRIRLRCANIFLVAAILCLLSNSGMHCAGL